MKRKLWPWLLILTSLAAIVVLSACGGQADEPSAEPAGPTATAAADLPEFSKNYYDVKNVVLYLDLYGELPPNYITKEEARKLGWKGGPVEKYSPGAAIGGDRFSNREGQLPEAAGRTYTECDIDTNGGLPRGTKRLIFSNDWLYFYTTDHYQTFTELTVTDDFEVIQK